MEFRHLVIDGPPAVGKTALADRLGTRLDATVVLDEVENPFLPDAIAGRAGAAFQAQLFSLLARHRQQRVLRQGDLFAQVTVADYLFDKDKVYAYLALDDNELFIYQRLYELLAPDVPSPDIVVYLQAPADTLFKRMKTRAKLPGALRAPPEEFVREIVDAFNHFYFHYDTTPLLVVETSRADLAWPDDAVDELLKQVRSMSGGTQYFVPRTR